MYGSLCSLAGWVYSGM